MLITDIIVDVQEEFCYVSVCSKDKNVAQSLSKYLWTDSDDAINYAKALAQVSGSNYIVRMNYSVGEQYDQQEVY